MKRLALLLPLLCGCPGHLDDPSRYEHPTCPDVERDLLDATCAKTQCHGSVRQGGLDLRAPGARDRLLDHPSRCGGLLIDSADPAASVLYEKTGPMPPCGDPMPQGTLGLDEFRRACLLDWIERAAAGAP